MTDPLAPLGIRPDDIRAVPLSAVTPWEGNPRRGNVRAIQRSLRRWGQQRPIVVQRSSDRIVAGNHVWHGMMAENAEALAVARDGFGPDDPEWPEGLHEWDAIVVAYTDLDDREARAYLLADNRISELGKNDDDALARWLAELVEDEAVDDALGYASEDIDRLLRSIAEAGADVDEAPPPPRKVWVKPGQMFGIGRHRLLVGDCTQEASWERLMGGQVGGMVWTDPPYGVDYEGGTPEHLTIANDAPDEVALRALLDASLAHAVANIRNGASLYCAAPGGDRSTVFVAALKALGVYRQTIIWVKDQLVLGRQDYHWRHEPVHLGVKPAGRSGKPVAKVSSNVHYGWKPGAAHYFVSDRTHDTVWEIPRPKASPEHPCLPPDELVLTAAGWRSIGDIATGDRVLAHDGQWQPVTDVTRHPFEGDLVRIRVAAAPDATLTTGNHPWLVSRGGKVGWVDASEVRKGDHALTPDVVADGPRVDPEWAWALGLWAAEGSTLPAGHGQGFYLVWTLGDDEARLVDRLRALYPEVRTNRNGDHAISVMLFDPVEARRYVGLVGRGARAKWLHPDVLGWQREAREQMLAGYLEGDGYRLVEEHRAQWRAKTASRDLATSIQLLAEGLGRGTSVRRYTSAGGTIRGRAIPGRPYYDVVVSDYARPTATFEGRRYHARAVKEVGREAYVGDVVNLSVARAPSFQTVAGMTHNTMKPVDLVERSILASSKRGDIVLDPFAGSGTTLVACERTARVGYAMELDPRYAQVIIERMKTLFDLEAVAL